MATASLLLAGFGTHDTVRSDPAAVVVEALPRGWDAEARDLDLIPLVLPWSHQRAPDLLTRRLADLSPDLLLLLDVDPTSPDYILQVLAANWVDDPSPDADGAIVRETIIDPEGPVAYRSHLPLDGLWDKFLVERVPVRMGHKAGTSVFNHAYYRAMHFIHTQGLGTLGGAVHIPASPGATEGVEGREVEDRSDDLDMLVMTARHLFAKLAHDEAKHRH